MSWARYEPEQLRYGIQEVKNLWNEKEQHGLAEMTKDSNHGKCHAREITKGVTNKHR